MPIYHERLWPGFWLFIATLLIVPATILVLAPISMLAGIIAAITLYCLTVGILVFSSPTIAITDGTLTAGRASIPVKLLGNVTEFQGDEAVQERGPRLDARAHLMIRGWISPIIKVSVTDANDPTPYWIISTRNPTGFANALREAISA
ncbi:DUF3093 domain-containing protein [Klugiella xanthotipulae]|uniref:DUF3093 family protein n=1 Tax=Klugiella xanthotipulae TaxID=244735 RepID=A0A543HS44_9MICO|nr:DUF3093 domain-containing protein [Klugiella xanthotipulae]TQM61171.1 DUF3093 family protein [Klugiella xanthotipulae]